MRGDVYLLSSNRDAIGHEQRGTRYCVALQSDYLQLTTVLVAPTSTSARDTEFRPVISVAGRTTKVLVEQAAAVDLSRLGSKIGTVAPEEMDEIDHCLRMVFSLY